MKLQKARVQNYRSVRDSGWFDVEQIKTIMVGPNEAGKSAILNALQQIRPPAGVKRFDPLRDYPRSSYNDITKGTIKPSEVTVVEAHFELEDSDKQDLPAGFENCTYVFGRRLDNGGWHRLENAPPYPTYKEIKADLLRLAAHADGNVPPATEENPASETPTMSLQALTKGWDGSTVINETEANALKGFLDKILPLVDENNDVEVSRHAKIEQYAASWNDGQSALSHLEARVPVFVLFSNYFRVHPLIHLEHLATRLEQNLLDDSQYDYGNQCLLRLLGFSARELSNLGKAAEPSAGDEAALQAYRDQLDKRRYQLNAASVRLTDEINKVWVPDKSRGDADRLKVQADGQYLKVVVEDDLGVEIELNQRSEGYQWLVSFFVVFFAESAGKHKNAILLLDEPGLSLHGLKQREFRETVSRLATVNQTLFTTHSPFLVGPDELDFVRVVEMTDRKVGTKVHTTVAADDPAALLPLQEALGYDLAQSLFMQQKNLILEGLTDYWYVEATADLLREADIVDLDEKIALIPAKSAGKVVYFATILHAHHLKVAALLDSDAAGDSAAAQDTLVNTLGNKRILRTKDSYSGTVPKPEIEDLLRTSLIEIAKSKLSWDVSATAANHPNRPIIDIFEHEIANFSKYKLAKAYLRWARDHSASDLTATERKDWLAMIASISKALK